MSSLSPQDPLRQLSTYELAALSRRAPCGTPGAYLRHLRNGEPTDEACRKAHRETQGRQRAERNERRGNVAKLRQLVGRLRTELAQAEQALADAEAQSGSGTTGSAVDA